MSKTEPTHATAVRDGLTVPSPRRPGSMGTGGRVLMRGDEVVLDEGFIEATTNRFGVTPFPGIVADEEAQRARWGVVHLVPGRLAENPTLAAAIAAEREAEVLERVRLADHEARRYGRRALVVRVPEDVVSAEVRAAIEAQGRH